MIIPVEELAAFGAGVAGLAGAAEAVGFDMPVAAVGGLLPPGNVDVWPFKRANSALSTPIRSLASKSVRGEFGSSTRGGRSGLGVKTWGSISIDFSSRNSIIRKVVSLF